MNTRHHLVWILPTLPFLPQLAGGTAELPDDMGGNVLV